MMADWTKSIKWMRFPASLPPQGQPAGEKRPVLCIGNFDGAHRGHAKVVQAARHLAAEVGREVFAVGFEPHPRQFFQPGAPFFRLTPPALRRERLMAIGFDGLAELTFDAALAQMSAEDFVRIMLVNELRAAGVVVGQDFHFGKDRKGTPDFLAEAGARHGFATCFVAPALDANGAVISSSAIRRALSVGDLDHANAMLGYAFDVLGEVVHGAKRGRELGYPTANIVLDPACGLRQGVYAVRVKRGGSMLTGVASFGRRPMFDNGAPLLEVFVLDFSGDLYGETLRVSFEAFLRDEARFASVEALIRQMDTDQVQARRILAAQ